MMRNRPWSLKILEWIDKHQRKRDLKSSQKGRQMILTGRSEIQKGIESKDKYVGRYRQMLNI